MTHYNASDMGILYPYSLCRRAMENCMLGVFVVEEASEKALYSQSSLCGTIVALY